MNGKLKLYKPFDGGFMIILPIVGLY